MIQLARSPLSKMSPDPAANSREKEGLVLGTPPPRSPPLSNGHRRVSTGIEEDAIQSLMKLATPVKSPGPLHMSPRGGGGNGTENTPAANTKSFNGTASGGAGGGGGSITAEMTPVSLFCKSRQQGELGQLQSPFQSPFRSFQFSPSCLFSPPGAGTLDIPLASGDTPGPGLHRDIWQHATPDTTPRSRRTGSASGIHGVNGSVGGGGVGGARGPGNASIEDGSDGCGKRKGKALFTDKRGPQDHSRFGQGWCLDTPGRSRDGIHHAHLGVADIPATPDRVTTDGSHVLPPTPQLLAPTPPRPPRPCGMLDSTGGEGAAGILLGLRSPEGNSSFGGGEGGNIAHSLFAGLDEGYDACRPIAAQNGSAVEEGGDTPTANGGGNGDSHRRGKGAHWNGDCWTRGTNGGANSDGCAARKAKTEESEQEAPQALKLPQPVHSAPPKRYRRWASPASSLRNSHCKSSFKIEGMTLIRTGSCSSSGSERSRASGEGGSANGRKQAAGTERSNCRVRSRGQSIADEPLSPPRSAVVSPEVPPLALSRSRSLPSSPAKPPVPARKESTATIASTGPTEPFATAPRASTRAPRSERSRRSPPAAHAAATLPSRNTPSRSTRKSSSQATGSTVSSSGASVLSRVSSDADTSFNSPEATITATAASLRRGRTTPRPQTPPATADVSSGPTGTEVAAKPSEPEVENGNGNEPIPLVSVEERHGPTTCNCKKSKCLKLYCECFQRRQYCTDCNCQECLNTSATEDLRQSAIQSTIERNPAAFVSKFEKRAGGRRLHNAGCNCKKSACLKKYCECFQAGVTCASNCKCTNCKNFEGASGGRKRRAAEAGLASTQPPRTPPRPSGRAQRGAVMAVAMATGGAGVTRDPSPFGRFMEATNEADSGGDNVQVQVGEEVEVEIDGKEKSPPLAKVLRANAFSGTADSTVASVDSDTDSSNGVATDTATTSSHGDGASDVSDKSHVALASTRLGARSQGTSPAAAAVADHAIARSLLDMGGTPPQVKVKTAAADDTAGFKLSVATGDGEGDLSDRKGFSGRGGDLDLADSNGAVKENAPATESEICVAGDSGSEAVGTGKRVGYAHEGAGVGMDALLNSARSEVREKQALLASPSGEVSRGSHGGRGDDGQERESDWNGDLDATEGKTGGRCLTPSLPAASPPTGTATAATAVAPTALKPKLPGFGAVTGFGKSKVVGSASAATATFGIV